jgi:hypothetical protein
MDSTAEAMAAPVGELLTATATQLRQRRDDLEPLVGEYERVQEIAEAIGELPAVGDPPDDDHGPRRDHAELIRDLGRIRTELSDWSLRLEPLVREYEQILHVLHALDSAPTVSGARRRPRAGRTSRRPGVAGGQRLEELRALLDQPRTRADIAARMSLSPSRVTALLEQLADAAEVVEIPDPARPTRKLWALSSKTDDTVAGDGAPVS